MLCEDGVIDEDITLCTVLFAAIRYDFYVVCVNMVGNKIIQVLFRPLSRKYVEESLFLEKRTLLYITVVIHTYISVTFSNYTQYG